MEKKLLNFPVNTFYMKLPLNICEKPEKLCHRWRLQRKATIGEII